jgi:hypothetical protein
MRERRNRRAMRHVNTHGDRTDVLAACDRAVALAPQTWPPDLPPGPYTGGEPEWYPFEHDAWRIGEGIRACLASRPSLRRDPVVLGAVQRVAATRNLRRGRQSFVMALAFPAASAYARDIGALLDDRDVCGHAADALLKMGAEGFEAGVRPLLESKHGWIRRSAEKYLTWCDRRSRTETALRPSRLRLVSRFPSSGLLEVSASVDRDDLEPLLRRLSRVVDFDEPEIDQLLQWADNLEVDDRLLAELTSAEPLGVVIFKDDEECFDVAFLACKETARKLEGLWR